MELVLDRIAQELSLPRTRVAAVAALLAEGNTVPFIARYRKEATGSTDEVAIRAIEERVGYYKELLDRRAYVLGVIEKQGKLTPDLKERIESTWVKTTLEDLFLPYRPKKRTKATDARERGLEPLLDALLADSSGADPLLLAAPYVQEGQEGLATPSACVEGAGHILAERLSENADIRAWLRQVFHDTGVLQAALREERKEGPEALRFKPYWDFREPIRKMPAHRVLALRRGEKLEILNVKLVVDREKLVDQLAQRVVLHPASGFRPYVKDVAADAFDRLLAPTLETDVRAEAKRKADTEAIKVFQTNLDHLLLAPPAGQRCTLGVDPGIRTGCKLAVINRLGQFMESATIYPLEPKRDLEGSRATLEALCAKYPIESVAVGNGTGGREAEAFLKAWIQDTGRSEMVCVSVSESGASVYSASDIAREEFPEQDVTVRGAISIARRFQDPLSELVKVDPKSIGVGQYQHDVNQTALRKSLDEVVESCVNRVGVDLNSASYRLLSYVAGIGEVLAKHIVEWRYQNGAFRHREQLLQVPRFGDKAFQQSAGFLRIHGAENPLDASAVHPESYGVVQRICQHVGKTVPELVGNDAVLDALDPALFVDERFGVETVRDILQELRKPGRDPRASFANVAFQEGVRKPEDLQPGMELDGVVTNVTDFGAFVDVGVHQDGLVHLSEISHRYVKNPADVLAVGQNVRVKVLGVELKAKRISLSIKALLPAPGVRAPRRDSDRPAGRSTPTPEKAERAPKARPPRLDRERRPRGEGERSRPAASAREPKAEAPLNASLDELMARFNRGLK